MSCARPLKTASIRVFSSIEPITSPITTGGSAVSTGICEMSNFFILSIVWRTVSLGCTCTSPASSGSLVPIRVGDRRVVAGRQEAVGPHPPVAEDLAEVPAAAVGQQDHHDVVGAEVAGGLETGCHGETAGPADEQSLLARHPPGVVERLGVGARDDLVDDRAVVGGRPEVLADALDEVRPAGAARVDRALRDRRR